MSAGAELESRNAEFWNELCGTSLAQHLGITGADAESLRTFDRAYMDLYPYLATYVDGLAPEGKDVLEIGLGYGTLGQQLIERGARYHGLDIAPGPVAMMRHRAALTGDSAATTRVGSALEIPWPEASFDAVVSIGCLHHTGDLPACVGEVHRVLRPGGTALVSFYNRRSMRRILARSRLRDRAGRRARVARRYDANAAGEPAPHTDFVSRRAARRLFGAFDVVRVESRNADDLRVARWAIPRARVLDNVGRLAGLDLYVQAAKHP